MSLDKVLQEKKETFTEFKEVAIQVLNYLPNVINKFQIKNDYKLFSSNIAGTIKYTRPVNRILFIEDALELSNKIEKLDSIFRRIKNGDIDINISDKFIINSVLYTIQQAIGIGLDLLVNPNSARKHVGNRFEGFT